MKLINVSKVYHNKNNDVIALSDINLSFDNNGMTFIVGESGCGKTTLLNIISGHDQEYAGSIEKDGKVEIIGQEIMLMENLSIYENLLLVSDDKNEINLLLDRFQLKEKNKKVKKLSVGEKKRVQIIRSLLTRASYLVCDEPTAALDYENRKAVMNMLKDISSDISVIIVTHDIAIVEEYKDRVIRMGKGCIVSDEAYTCNKICHKDTLEKRSLRKQMKLLYKMMVSRWQETLFQYGLLFFTVLVIYVVTFIFPSLNLSIKASSNWMNSKNVILSQPNEGNNIRRSNTFNEENVQESTRFYYYDLYHKEDVYFAKENIPGIIGYQIGWDHSKYRTIDVDSSSFTPKVNIDSIRRIVENYWEEYEKTGIKPFPQYLYSVEELASYDEEYPNDSYPKDRYDFYDFRNFEGFNGEGYGVFDFSLDVLPRISDIVLRTGKYEVSVVPYQLFSDSELSVVYGNMPVEPHEVLLTKKVASHFLKYFGFSSLEELIGQEIKLSICTSLQRERADYSFIICGITYMESRFEDQVFLIDGALDEIYSEMFNYDPDIVTYQYMNFLIDPKKDSEMISTRLDRLLESNESHFIVYNASTLVNTERYQDPAAMMVFSMFALVTLIMLYIIMQILLNKRIKKENALISHYQYHSFLLQLARIVLLLLAVAIFQLACLSLVNNELNHLANSIGFSNIVEYNFINYFLSFILTMVGMILLEGGIYAVRIKKHL